MLIILILQLAYLPLFLRIILLGVKQLFYPLRLELVELFFLLFHLAVEFDLLHLEGVDLVVELFQA
jgi:hypothetical protein